MTRFLGRYADIAYALLRIVAGLLFAVHGVQKVFGVLGGTAMPLTSMPGIAGVIELVTGILIAAGLLTSWAAFLASGEMAVAYFMVHAPQGFWPHLNKGELAVLYCFLFLYMACRGGGRYALGRGRLA